MKTNTFFCIFGKHLAYHQKSFCVTPVVHVPLVGNPCPRGLLLSFASHTDIRLISKSNYLLAQNPISVAKLIGLVRMNICTVSLPKFAIICSLCGQDQFWRSFSDYELLINLFCWFLVILVPTMGRLLGLVTWYPINVSCPRTQQVSLPACSPHYSICVECQAEKL